MENAVVYARVSSKEQEAEGYSISSQSKTLRAYAAKNNYSIVEEFTDVQTAKKAGRTQFGRMVKFLKANKHTKHVLVEKTDRLHRNIDDYVIMNDLMERYGIKIHMVKEGDVFHKGSVSHAKQSYLLRTAGAKFTIDNLSEEVKKGMAEKAAQGIYPSRVPYGYKNVYGETGKKLIKVVPSEAALIKKMFELYGTGSYSLSTLRIQMLAEGMVYHSGKNFHISKVEFILKNEFYTGAFKWNGIRYEKGSHEPIISREQFRRVQAVLLSPYKSKSRKGLFPYTNLIKCGVCGYVITAEIKKEKYIYYHCTGYKKNCKQPYIKQEAIEELFEGLLASIHIPDHIKSLIVQSLRESYKDKVEYHGALVEQIEAQSKKLQARIDQAYIDKLDGVITDEFWRTNAKKWTNDKEDLLIKLMAIQRADAKYLEYTDTILELANKASGMFIRQNAEEKRKMVILLTSNCVYKDGKLDLELKPVFNEIMKSVKTENWCAQ